MQETATSLDEKTNTATFLNFPISMDLSLPSLHEIYLQEIQTRNITHMRLYSPLQALLQLSHKLTSRFNVVIPYSDEYYLLIGQFSMIRLVQVAY